MNSLLNGATWVHPQSSGVWQTGHEWLKFYKIIYWVTYLTL